MKIPILNRPIYEGCQTPEDQAKAMTLAMEELKKVNLADGMDFAAKTSMAIAYERHVESLRYDRLFYDPLAKELYQPYGQTMSDALAFGLTHAIFDPPGADIGLGLEGHVLYTAARTRLINDHIEKWLVGDNNDNKKCKKQVLNLGSGCDTRVFWLECLSRATAYWEVDQESVTKYRDTILQEMDAKQELPATKCKRISITMDFNKESILDLPNTYAFDVTIPTCFILEGLIMYLPRKETEELMENINSLSAPGSYLILNFSVSDAMGPSIDEIDAFLVHRSWNHLSRVMFGEEDFNYGRYPTDKPANNILGFAFYQKGK